MKKILLKILSKYKLLNLAKTINMLCDNIHKYWNTLTIKIMWRSFNQHNHTFVANTINEMYFPLDKVKVGMHTYGPLCVHSYEAIGEQLKIGHYCSISIGVKFILGGNHSRNTFSTFPFRFFNNGMNEAWSKGPIVVEDDVWIGTDAIILSGVTLAKGTVIAAGSVVTKSTLPYSVIGGTPAKLISFRFTDSIIKALMDIDYEKLDENLILECLPELYTPLDEQLLTKIKKDLFGS